MIWWFSLRHFDDTDTKCPDINRVGVAAIVELFRTHVVRRAHEGIGLDFGGCDAEVGKFGLALHSKEDVCRFDVAVHELVGVAVLKSLEDVAHNARDLVLGKLDARDLKDVANGAHGTVLEDQPDLLVGGDVRVVQPHDVLHLLVNLT